MATLYSLPPEIHGQIIPYLTDADLHEYRLACKYFAAVGAKELFRVIPFHASSTSIQRLQNFAKSEGLKTCVHTLVWDSNLWDIHVNTEEDWGAYLHTMDHFNTLQDNYRKLYPTSYWLPKEIEEKIVDVEAHSLTHDDRWQDEKTTLQGPLHQSKIANFLQRFPALREICIFNGAFEIRNRTLRKTGACIERNTLDLIPRGDNLFDPELSEGPLGVHALTRALEGMSALNRPWRLEINALDYIFFTPKLYPEGFEAKLGKLTSLTLTLSYWRGEPYAPEGRSEECADCKIVLNNGLFKKFLRSMKVLRLLSLSLHHRRVEGKFDAAASIRDMLPLEEDWTGLRELSLTSIDTTEEDFVRLVRNQSFTLEKIHLKDICLVPDGSWIQILESIQPGLRLTSATFSGTYLYGCCEKKPGALIWWLGGDIGPALSKYLTSGGECPLRKDNTVWHGVTADGYAWFVESR